MRVRGVLSGLPVLLLLVLAACQTDMPSLDSIRDSKLFDRRIKETPRQKVVRECQQECDHYRVECMYCHTTDKIADIRSPDALSLNAVGQRAQIMRKSPSFGLGKDCANCHQTKFRLTRSAQQTFGSGGEKHSEAQKELNPEK
ncbi:MAG: hypothetical protein NTW87_32945 [Planctomycetota bacterium]|nr:hypothetical protein [Planctomycetota bacterium]